MAEKQDYLYEDPILSNQKFVCISVLTPKNFKEETTMSTLKVRGSYETYEEAKKRADFLRNIDPNINVYVGEVGKWLPFEDNPENAKDHEYQNEQLNKMMKGYVENQEKAKEFHEQRKNEMIMKALKENDEKEKRRKDRDERRAKGEIVDDDAEEKLVTTTIVDSSVETNVITETVDKKKELEMKEKNIKEKEEEIKVDKETLQKTQEEYNAYQKKNEKIKKELEEAKKVYEQMLAAGTKK
jgi:myosin heavy subunit